jgi:hypothetical protein
VVKRMIAIMVDQKLLEIVEYFNYMRSIMTNVSKCTREIKTKIVMTKAAFRKKSLFAKKLTLILRNKLLNYYNWSIVLCSAESWTLRSRSEIKSFECGAGEGRRRSVGPIV